MTCSESPSTFKNIIYLAGHLYDNGEPPEEDVVYLKNLILNRRHPTMDELRNMSHFERAQHQYKSYIEQMIFERLKVYYKRKEIREKNEPITKYFCLRESLIDYDVMDRCKYSYYDAHDNFCEWNGEPTMYELNGKMMLVPDTMKFETHYITNYRRIGIKMKD